MRSKVFNQIVTTARRQVMFVCCILFFGCSSVHAADYVGSAQCENCHESQVKAWQDSDHFQAMRPATSASVLGDFTQTVEFHGIQSQFLVENQQFFVETLGDEKRDRFRVLYTFGHYPLQQYLVETSQGRLQAFNVAWDSREKAEGGQRWFHLRVDMDQGSPFYWTRHFQNWNGRCADCHSTNVSRGYDPTSNAYRTQFSEHNVGCEACHGPASDHVDAAVNGEFMSLNTPGRQRQWEFKGNARIAHAVQRSKHEDEDEDEDEDEEKQAMIDGCGGCHSRRSQIASLEYGKSYADQFQLSLLEPGLYHADGQIQDEVFVLGSFLQSKMHQQGVTCSNCHDSHSAKVKFSDNRLCAQCHNPSAYDQVSHLRHKPGTSGSLCIDCHMPATTYMQVDERRDHRFGIPNPALTQELGIPNACNGCHLDKSATWASKAIGSANPDDEFARINTKIRTFDPLAVAEARTYISDETHPAIKRATLVSGLPLSQESIALSAQYLNHESVLLRTAAVRKVSEAPESVRRLLLEPVLADRSPAIRKEVGRALMNSVSELADDSAARGAIEIFRRSFQPTLDMPSTQTEVAQLEQALGRFDQAEEALNRALVIEPAYLPALLNLADLKRSQSDSDTAGNLLRQAVGFAPDSGAAHHSLGLYLIREKDIQMALQHLRQATERVDSLPRYSYVFAVALDSVTKTRDAIAILQAATRRWPNQFDLLMLEVLYREKVGLLNGIQSPLRALAKIAPNESAVQQRLEYYRVP